MLSISSLNFLAKRDSKAYHNMNKGVFTYRCNVCGYFYAVYNQNLHPHDKDINIYK